jgi:hypothetical protein
MISRLCRINATTIRFGFALLVAARIAGWAGPGSAAEMPYAGVTKLCDEAALIVEGEYLGQGRIQVAKVYKGALPQEAKGQIVATGLEKCSRTMEWTNRKIKTQRVLAFLNVHSVPLYLIGDGSLGIFWLEKEESYTYRQLMNPGGYLLTRYRIERGVQPSEEVSVEQLHVQLEVGLAASSQWQRALTIKNPAEAAKAMARFLRVETAPKGFVPGDYYRTLRERMAQFGAAAVPSLVEVLRDGTAKQEDLNLPVLILYDIGKPAQPAVPVLLNLLAKPGKTATLYICSALGATADPQAIPALRSLLASTDMQLAIAAAEGLATMKDAASFDAIAKLLPAHATKASGMQITDLLRALHRLDARRAAPLLGRYADDPALRDWRDYLMSLLKG